MAGAAPSAGLIGSINPSLNLAAPTDNNSRSSSSIGDVYVSPMAGSGSLPGFGGGSGINGPLIIAAIAAALYLVFSKRKAA